MEIDQHAIVGVGLMGGSLARASRRRRLARRIVGVERNPSHRERALALGLLDEASDELALAAGADIVVFCTPVDAIALGVRTLAPLCRPGTLLTDVGSTKAGIVRGVEGQVPPGIDFVGSHPLAGSEKDGPEHADARLLEGRLVLVTPTDRTSPEALTRTTDFWQALGARVALLGPEEHDQALALTSHLPHLVSSALASILPRELYGLTATGFRDTTRLAAGDPRLWTAICQENAPALLAALALLQTRLDEFRQALTVGDGTGIAALLEAGRKVKEELTARPTETRSPS